MILTPKEKAKELVEKMEVDVNDYTSNYPSYCYRQAKECALIAVDEIINIMSKQQCNKYSYWIEVKNEINKL